MELALECCLCQLVWTENRTNHKAWEELRAQARETACPGAGCCSLLHNVTDSKNDISKRRAIMSDDPDAMLGVTTTTVPSTESNAVTFAPDNVPEEFDFSMGGGINLPSLFPFTEGTTEVATQKTQHGKRTSGMRGEFRLGRRTGIMAYKRMQSSKEPMSERATMPKHYWIVPVCTTSSLRVRLCAKSKNTTMRRCERMQGGSEYLRSRNDVYQCARWTQMRGSKMSGQSEVRHPLILPPRSPPKKLKDVNECSTADQCKPWERCVNQMGYFVCQQKLNCEHGTRINANGTSCDDIDECTEKSFNCRSDEICMNKPGSYDCVPSPCSVTQIVKKQDPKRLCYWAIQTQNLNDVDECQVFGSQASCPDPRARCVNTNGSHLCACPDGFIWVDYPISKCKDIDECAQQPDRCGKEHRCVNVEGSYNCVCAPGYQATEDSKRCVDIDECQAHLYQSNSRNLCPHSLCVNTPGSYECRCPDGFRLGPGGRCYGKSRTMSKCTVSSLIHLFFLFK
ncbi:hypothetical protein FGIG_01343 [Fasciola gigantica]|uniref:EGF-like domain-containing protein n=1 Tax=Fasciola gigantica TaxID=46835 RepID=A0A504YK82_FASGI|nr:hypothetical protein FGIG_01343 [Fasciola gigantica]